VHNFLAIRRVWWQLWRTGRVRFLAELLVVHKNHQMRRIGGELSTGGELRGGRGGEGRGVWG